MAPQRTSVKRDGAASLRRGKVTAREIAAKADHMSVFSYRCADVRSARTYRTEETCEAQESGRRVSSRHFRFRCRKWRLGVCIVVFK